MRLSSLVKLRSFLPIVACIAAAGALAAACNSTDGGDGYYGDPPSMNDPSADPASVAIDTGATLPTSPGGGVGVFIEYTAGGHWQVVTQCDTNTSGLACGFDVFVSGVDPSTALSNPQPQDLEGRDTVSLQSDGSLHLATNTATSNGGLTFDAPAGAGVQVEMYLDGNIQPDFIYWVSDAVRHTGAPTDPINFTPTAP